MRWHKTTVIIVSGRGIRKSKPIKDDKGELLVTQEQQQKWWEDYFPGILSKDKDKMTQSSNKEAKEIENENKDIRIKLTPPSPNSQRLKVH